MPRSKASPGRRRLVVMFSLVAVLTLTATLLLAIAPPPLATSAPASLSNVIETTAIPPGRWTDVLLCNSPLDAAGGLENAAHFLLVRDPTGFALRPTSLWTRQQPAPPPAGVATVDPRCLVIAVGPAVNPAAAGDAIASLRTQLAIGPQRVWSISR